MKTSIAHFSLRALVGAVVLGASATQALAGILIGPTTVSIASGGYVNLGTITNAQVGSFDTLVISYNVTRADLTAGDAWLGVGINQTNTTELGTVLSSNAGFLTRTRSDSPLVDDKHQYFVTGSSLNVGVGSNIGVLGHSVRITITLSNQLNGTGSGIYEIDENSATFVTADHSLTRTFTFNPSGSALFTAGARDKGHSLNNFTVTAIPEPSSMLLLLGALGGFAVFRRRL